MSQLKGPGCLNTPCAKLMEMDRMISEHFTSHNNSWLRVALGTLTHLGTGTLWIPLYALFLIFLQEHFARLILTLILAELIGLVTIIALRYMTRRERPIMAHKYSFLTPWNRYSFPSHHTLRSFMIAVIVGTHFPGLLPWLLILAATVSFSRIYLSKHYLSDVLGGALLGILLAVASQRSI
jgi:undecaprenyl-diphosphatase